MTIGSTTTTATTTIRRNLSLQNQQPTTTTTTTTNDAREKKKKKDPFLLFFWRRILLHPSIKSLVLWKQERKWTAVIVVIITSFGAYLAGTSLLNRTVVNVLGISRRGDDAFGPFVTLLSLIYSIVLSQTYHYHFERQQELQNCLYEEVAALQLLYHHIITTTAATEQEQQLERRQRRLSALKEYIENIRDTAFSTHTSRSLSLKDSQYLMKAVLDDDSNGSSSSSSSSSSSFNNNFFHHLTAQQEAAIIHTAMKARALRTSHINSELPRVQQITERLLSYVILGGFVLVDLKAPILEALLFSVICGCFTTIHIFLVDLSDPFSGQWTVGTEIANDINEFMHQINESIISH